MRRMRRQQLKDKRKRHSLKYAANWPKENKMEVGKWVHGLSNSMCFVFDKLHAFKHNCTLLFKTNGQLPKF